MYRGTECEFCERGVITRKMGPMDCLFVGKNKGIYMNFPPPITMYMCTLVQDGYVDKLELTIYLIHHSGSSFSTPADSLLSYKAPINFVQYYKIVAGERF